MRRGEADRRRERERRREEERRWCVAVGTEGGRERLAREERRREGEWGEREAEEGGE